MITIVHVLSDANRSGAPVHVLALAKGLDNKQFQVAVVGPPGAIADDFQAAGIFYSVFDIGSKFHFQRITKLRLHIESMLADLVAAGKGSEFVVIHCHGPRAGLFGRLAAKSLPYPVVYTEHSWNKDYHLPNPFNEILQTLSLRYLDRYTERTIGVSQAVVDFLVASKITPKDKIRKIYNGIDIPAQPFPIADDSDSPIIGSIGSITWQKNQGWLIDALASIKKEIPGARLEIIGEGPQRERHHYLAANLKIADSMTFLGSIPHEKLPEYLKHWTIYIQPSTNESFGLALAEAVAYGLPALGSNRGAIGEVLGTKEATFEMNGPEEFQKAVSMAIDLLKNKEKRQALWEKEYKQVKQFTAEKMIVAHEQLYAELIEKPLK